MQWLGVRDESMEAKEEMGGVWGLGMHRGLERRETKEEEKQRHG